jgi:heparanase 1
MLRERGIRLGLEPAVSIGCVLASLCWPALSQGASSIALAPATMSRLGSIDERFQSYNIEMVEVTGGYFWRPYGDDRRTSSSPIRRGIPAGMDPAMYAYRKPIDLSSPRLRRLAAALGPAYLRVSGTWANATHFDDAGRAAASPPAGFNGVLTREQWKGVIAFARAVDAKLVTSFATSPGTRDAQGVWTPVEAAKLIAHTHALGGTIAAAEFMNEPDLAAMGGAPAGYDAASYGRDIAVFRTFLKQASPQTILLGPGTVSEDGALGSEKLLIASGPVFDVLSYHYYGAASQRCTKAVPSAQVRDESALSGEWLSGAKRAAAFHAGLRDKYAPGKPLWITETADAACGGHPWDKTFLDSFRYLAQLGRMAALGVQVAMHNTLAASDYGLLDENSFAPRPNYWAALLWRRLMGTIVLDPGASSVPRLHLYAHCLRGKPGGIALLAINQDRTGSQSLDLAMPARRYTLTAAGLTDMRVQMNGRELRLGAHDELPSLEGEPVAAGHLDLAPASITFLAIADAANPACR